MVYPVFQKTVFPLAKKAFNLQIKGIENLKKHENFIFAMNHESALDLLLAYSILIPATDRKLSVMVDSDYYDNVLFKFVLKKFEAVRVQKTGKFIADASSLDRAAEIIKKGNNILIYPEGTVKNAPAHKIGHPHTGVIRLAIANKKSIIPIGIEGSYMAWKFPLGFRIAPWKILDVNFRTPIVVNIGKEIRLDKYFSRDIHEKTKEDYRILHKLVDDLMNDLSELTGLEFDKKLDLVKEEAIDYYIEYDVM